MNTDTEIEKTKFPSLFDLKVEIQEINPNQGPSNSFDDINEKNNKTSDDFACINLLNDDCLTNIFQYLPIANRIKIERVCQRWLTVSKTSWFDCQELSINDKNLNIKPLNDSMDEEHIVSQIISRCGTFLKSVDINTDKINLRKSQIISYLAEHCRNIETLTLQHDNDLMEEFLHHLLVHLINCEVTVKEELDDQLIKLFKNNQNLKSLKFQGINIKGTCFKSLSKDFIKKISLRHCNYITPNCISQLLSNLKNLKILSIVGCGAGVIEIVIDKLINSECSLQELTLIEQIDDIKNCKLTQLFLKQKNLQVVNLGQFKLTKEILINLPKETLQNLSFLACNVSSKDLLCSLPKLKQLNSLAIDIDKIDNIHLEAISACVNLKSLNLTDIQNSLVTSGAEYHFTKLRNLEILHIYANDWVTDDFLRAISECKKLFYLDISYCDNVSNTGIMYLASLPNLRILDLTGLQSLTDESLKGFKTLESVTCDECDNINNNGLSCLVKNNKNLRILSIDGCKNVTNDLVTEIIENSDTAMELLIFFENSGIILKDNSNLPTSKDNITFHLKPKKSLKIYKKSENNTMV